MSQNKNQLIQLFISNISNAIVHEILENAIGIEDIKRKYNKEIKTSLDIAKHYRIKLNPIDKPLFADSAEIKNKITQNVRKELLSRISKGYQNINLDLIDITINKFLKETKII